MELFDRIRERFLIGQFQRGSAEAFVSLVRRYERRVLYYLKRFERDPDRALDVLQEVWMTAWSARTSLRDAGAFRTWIYRIAHGKIVESIRVETRRRRAEQESPRRETTSVNATDTALQSAELVHFALSRITPAHREVLTLRFLEEMSLAEIAAVTELPIGTVKSRLHYAGQEILSVIEEHGDVKR